MDIGERKLSFGNVVTKRVGFENRVNPVCIPSYTSTKLFNNPSENKSGFHLFVKYIPGVDENSYIYDAIDHEYQARLDSLIIDEEWKNVNRMENNSKNITSDRNFQSKNSGIHSKPFANSKNTIESFNEFDKNYNISSIDLNFQVGSLPVTYNSTRLLTASCKNLQKRLSNFNVQGNSTCENERLKPPTVSVSGYEINKDNTNIHHKLTDVSREKSEPHIHTVFREDLPIKHNKQIDDNIGRDTEEADDNTETCERRFDLEYNLAYIALQITDQNVCLSEVSITLYVQTKDHCDETKTGSMFQDLMITELAITLLKSFLWPYDNVKLMWVSSLQRYIKQWTSRDSTVTVLFPHQRLNQVYKAAVLFSFTASLLVRHPDLVFLHNLANVLQIPQDNLLLLNTINMN